MFLHYLTPWSRILFRGIDPDFPFPDPGLFIAGTRQPVRPRACSHNSGQAAVIPPPLSKLRHLIIHISDQGDSTVPQQVPADTGNDVCYQATGY